MKKTQEHFIWFFVNIIGVSFVCFLVDVNRYNLKKLTYEERKNKLIERVKALNGAGGADDDDEDDEE